MGGLHNLIVVAVADQARSSEFASRVPDLLFRRLVVGIAGDPQNQLRDRQQLRVQLHDLGENRPFELGGHGRAKTRPAEASKLLHICPAVWGLRTARRCGNAPRNWTGPRTQSEGSGPGPRGHWNQPNFVMETTGRVASAAASFIPPPPLA